mgnify:CR=1 FL=1
MPFVSDIVKYDSLSIVGLEKNTGKTEALNYILRRLPSTGAKLAVTSIGIDGEQRLFDASILTGSAYKPLSDEDTFKNCKVVDGVVTWLDEEIDCAPEYMYVNSYEYPSIKPAI